MRRVMADMKQNTPFSLHGMQAHAAAYTSDVDQDARLDRIEEEFRHAFEFLKTLPTSVTIFGSAMSKPGSMYYEKSRQLSSRLASELDLAIVTGGGPGIMAAANQGAAEAGGQSIGMLIDITNGEARNEFANRTLGFHYFFARKVALSFSASMYIFFPGGYGTMNEFFELIMLIQTNKIERLPIYCYGASFWHPLERFFDYYMVRSEGYISAQDLKIFTITDSVDEIVSAARSLAPRT